MYEFYNYSSSPPPPPPPHTQSTSGGGGGGGVVLAAAFAFKSVVNPQPCKSKLSPSMLICDLIKENGIIAGLAKIEFISRKGIY